MGRVMDVQEYPPDGMWVLVKIEQRFFGQEQPRRFIPVQPGAGADSQKLLSQVDPQEQVWFPAYMVQRVASEAVSTAVGARVE